MNIPFVSVILPTYNRARLLERSVLSVLDQTYSRLELIVVDDASTDNTKEVIEAIGDPRLRYLRCEENGGAAAARNAGIRAASYDWIAFQDSDDVWRPDKLKTEVSNIDGTAGLIYCSFLRHDGKGEGTNIIPSPERPFERRNGVLFGELLLGNFITMQTVLVHKNILHEAGLFNERLKNHEDYDLLLRISQKTRIKHVDEVLVDVFETEGSVGLNVENYIDSYSIILSEYREIFQEAGIWEERREQYLEIAASEGKREQAEKLLAERINGTGA